MPRTSAERILVGGVPPVKRWYDARQRCAVRLLASWLKVPWKMVVNFECLLVYRLLLPPEDACKASLGSWEHGVRAAKIGAASLGIGAIFAVSGGCKSPPTQRTPQMAYISPHTLIM